MLVCSNVFFVFFFFIKLLFNLGGFLFSYQFSTNLKEGLQPQLANGRLW